ncbi:FAD:protein FMN transferase [Neisseria musculi]|uniref:FAD:protein FMN transferase n=1 Tax=Neisseria musculi TaxID=1815583 RepID=UPI0031B57833
MPGVRHAPTEGVIDVTIGPSVSLWGFGPDKSMSRVPTAQQLSAAEQRAGQSGRKPTGRLKTAYIFVTSFNTIGALCAHGGASAYLRHRSHRQIRA